MDDDFNTAAALGHLFDAIRALNRLAPGEPATERERAGMFLAGYELLDPLFAVLGLLRTGAKEYFQERLDSTHVGGISAEMTIPGAVKLDKILRITEDGIERRIEARKAARANKDFAEADRIRKELETAGVLLEDGKSGTTWKYKE
jgi:cysteinyl-tRNA synthetase